jgi:hypothetical protein
MKLLLKLSLASLVASFLLWSLSVAQQKQPTVTFFHGNKVSFAMPAIGYLTSGKYASFDEVDVINVLEPEREEILARLKRQH